MVRPIDGRIPHGTCVVQASWPRTATTAAPGVSSAALNQRPSDGRSPSTDRYVAVVCSATAGRRGALVEVVHAARARSAAVVLAKTSVYAAMSR